MSATNDATPRDHVALLLCAGYGTRMGDLVATTPKPLLEVAGRPVLDHLLDQLRGLPRLAAVHVVSNARHAAAFRAWAGSRAADAPWPLAVHDDGSTSPDDRLGAVGDLGFVLDRLPVLPAGALVAAGDNILRFSLAAFWAHFLDGATSRVLALHEPRRERLERTGVLELGPDDRVLRLVEKPSEPPSTWACPPIYALKRPSLGRVVPYLARVASTDEIGRFIADLVAHETVVAERIAGERLDIGSPESYRRADELLRREAVIP